MTTETSAGTAFPTAYGEISVHVTEAGDAFIRQGQASIALSVDDFAELASALGNTARLVKALKAGGQNDG
jgi:hypothetical protein